MLENLENHLSNCPDVLKDFVLWLLSMGFSLEELRRLPVTEDLVITLRKDSIGVRLVSERWGWQAEVSIATQGDWFDAEIWAAYLSRRDPEDVFRSLEDELAYFKSHLPEIAEALAAHGESSVIVSLEALCARRAEILFGGQK